jgi:hypothetical protein
VFLQGPPKLFQMLLFGIVIAKTRDWTRKSTMLATFVPSIRARRPVAPISESAAA